MQLSKLQRIFTLALVGGIGVALAACSNDDNGGTAPQLINANTMASVGGVSLSAEMSDDGALEIIAEATLSDGSPAAGVPVQFRTSAGRFLNGAEAVTGARGRASVLLEAEEDATVVAVANGIESEPLLATAGAVRLVLTFRGDRKKADAREFEQIHARALSDDGSTVVGKLTVDWADGKVQTKNFSRQLQVRHVWKSAGSYKVKFTLRDAAGARLARAKMRVRVGAKVSVTLTITGDDRLGPGDTGNYNFAATRTDSEAVKGTLNINYGDGTTEVIENFKNRVSRSHVYATEGDYTITANLIASNRKSARTSSDVGVSDAPSTGDHIDLTNVFFLHYDVSGWPVTGTVTEVRISPTDICIIHTKSGGWPVVDGAEGNPWVVGNIGGNWYAGTYEWNRPGQVCKGVRRTDIGQHVKQVPMIDWVPNFGEQVYFFASTSARFGPEGPDNERTNAVGVPWNNGTFSFAR